MTSVRSGVLESFGTFINEIEQSFESYQKSHTRLLVVQENKRLFPQLGRIIKLYVIFTIFQWHVKVQTMKLQVLSVDLLKQALVLKSPHFLPNHPSRDL